MEEYFFQMEDTKIPIYLTDGLQEIADKITENGCNRVILVYDRALDDKLVDELGTIINKRVLCSKIGVSIDENTKNLDMVKRIIENILEYKIIENKKIAKDVFKMILEGDTSSITNPGQFINIELEGFYLRRPISICDYDDKTITVIYKVVGNGTDFMSNLKPSKVLNILTGLGNGFDINCDGDNPLLIGGGVGTPPMYNLCKKLLNAGKKPIVVLGFNTEEDVFFEKEFKDLGVDVYISTVDGSYGTKGFVTDIIKNLNGYSYFYACGPMPMLKAICISILDIHGQVSLEERMGCGFGACMGCTIETKNGYKRVCKDGPVFKKEEVIW